MVAAHALILGWVTGVRLQVERNPPPPPIFARIVVPDTAEPASPGPEPDPVPPEEVVAETRPPRPVPAVPDPTPVLAVPETAPTPPAADIVASAEAPPEVPGPIAASEVIESAQPAPPTAPARATADALPGNPDDVRNYLAAVMRQLNRYKTYPRALKKARIEGTVVIQFTIDHDGQLLASAVQQGSGQADLDRAALDMLARANPLPAIPDFMNRDELALAIPVEYSLITDR